MSKRRIARGAQRASTTLLLLAVQAAVAQDYYYGFDACGFNSGGMHSTPEAALAVAQDTFNRNNAATVFCPTNNQYWSTVRLAPTAAGPNGEVGFTFEITVYGIEVWIEGERRGCNPMTTHRSAPQYCGQMRHVRVIPRYFGAPPACDESCGGTAAFGNPVHPSTGHKSHMLRLAQVGAFELNALYDTRWRLPTAAEQPKRPKRPPSLGELWSTNLHRKLVMLRSLDGGLRSVVAVRGGAAANSFRIDGTGLATAESDTRDRLRQLSAQHWHYVDAQANTVEIYDAQGQLLAMQSMDSMSRLDFSYSDAQTPASVAPLPGLLIAMTDEHGKTLRLEYQSDGEDGARVHRIVRTDGAQVLLSYDLANMLKSVTWEDGTQQGFLYERPDLPWALTGVVNEQGLRVSQYGYSTEGHAISTGYADNNGGFSLGRHAVSYAATPQWVVSPPTYDPVANVYWEDHRYIVPTGTTVQTPGGQLALGMANVAGFARVTSLAQPAGAGSPAATQLNSYDGNGLLAAVDDFGGRRTCYQRDSRGQPTVRVEGLAAGTNCAPFATDGAPVPAGATRVSTRWHSLASLPILRAEPGKLTHFVYHGQPDTTAGPGAVANCAPPDAVLIGGDPMPLLCKRVEVATNDPDGAAGLLATPLPGSAASISLWVYNSKGQVLLAVEPNGAPTQFSYHSGSTPTTPAGSLSTRTNAMGHVWRHVRYDTLGRLRETADPNGVATLYDHDARGRLVGMSTAGATTTLGYHPTGELAQVIEPDGRWTSFTYDAARRLVSIANSVGARIDYTLDGAGNRVAETASDSTGALRRQVARVFDALNRLQQQAGLEIAP